MRRVQAAFLLALFICLGVTARQVHRPNLADFQVYDAAAELVREHRSIHMYDDADNEKVFQLKFAGSDTPFTQAAHRLGIAQVRLYIYPPILADLLLPLTFVSARTAGFVWLLINLSALFGIAWLMARLLDYRPAGLAGLSAVVGLFALFSTGMCLIWGQVTIVLLLLWTAGLFFYLRGRHAASAFVFALATAIKLTPLLVVVPLLVWREWRWLRAYAGFLLCFVAAMCLLNGPASLADYAFHVTPSMSGGGTPTAENKALLASAQMFYVALHGGAVNPVVMAIPSSVIFFGKLCSLLSVVAAIVCVYRLGARLPMADRLLTLALFAVLSVCVAPISWKHAYIVVFPVLGILWARAFRERVPNGRLLFLTFCSLELGSFVFDSLAGKLTHGAVEGVLFFLAPATGLTLVFTQLAAMRSPALRGASTRESFIAPGSAAEYARAPRKLEESPKA